MEKYYQIITVVIACVAFISPIAVALINNWHNSKMRIKEMAHEQDLKKLELDHQYAVKQLDVYYKEKKDAFQEFVKSIAYLVSSPYDSSQLQKLHSTAAQAILFCSEENKQRIKDLLMFANRCEENGRCLTREETTLFTQKTNEISYHLNEELKSTANHSK